MANFSVYDLLTKVFGSRGLPFPNPAQTPQSVTGGVFPDAAPVPAFSGTTNAYGTPVKKVTNASLGRYTFMPVTINNYEMPNALIIISGEKMIVETDVVDVGTVYEKVFTKPYDITIIATLISNDGTWPEEMLSEIVSIWGVDDIVTLNCALADYFLQPDNNFLITKISILDNNGAENCEVIQIEGKSNVDFVLEIM